MNNEENNTVPHEWSEVFQVDAAIVSDAYCQLDNYLIAYTEEATSHDYCALYFSSNDIYFPNTEADFRQRICEANFFEWYGMRFKKAWKHIFLRDIFKQWYLKGINDKIDSPERLLEFLRRETAGMKVITIGCSSGGYAAILYGCQLQAERIIAINPQFEIGSVILRSTHERNPLLFRMQHTDRDRYFDLRNIVDINSPSIFYFCSRFSRWDQEQLDYIKDCKNIVRLLFDTSHHGIPFLKSALPAVLNLEDSALRALSDRTWHPIGFTLRYAGMWATLSCFCSQACRAVYKRVKMMHV